MTHRASAGEDPLRAEQQADHPAIGGTALDQQAALAQAPDVTEGDLAGELDKPSTQRQLTIEQLAAARVLFSEQHAADLHDIIITTAMEALRVGPRSELDLLDATRRIWPGTDVDAPRLRGSLKIAQQAGYVVPVAGGTAGWDLTANGRAEVTNSRDWAREIFDTTASQIRDQLRSAGRDITDQEAALWTSVLRQALMAGISGMLAPYTGEVHRQGDRLVIQRWDRDAMKRVVEDAALTKEDAELMLGLTADAFDPLSPFGNELVTTIVAGYIVHAYVGRRDRADARGVVGSLRWNRVLLDTPYLLRLLGPDDEARPLEQVIAAAIHAGMEVIVLDHYIDELREVVARAADKNSDYIEAELKGGLGFDSMGLLSEEDVFGLWLRAKREGKYRDWQSLGGAVEGMPGQLALMGIKVRAHNNQDPGIVARFHDALVARIQGRGHRSPEAIKRDANTMTMVHRQRRRTVDLFWPGAWVVTTDSHMGPAFTSVSPETFSVTLSPAAWAGIISNCSEPADVHKLASAAATLFSEEAFLTIAGRFPVETAMNIAKTLGPASGGSTLDVRLAQIDDLLRDQPDFDRDNDRAGARITAEVMRIRSERMNKTYEEHGRRQKDNTDRMAAALAEAQRRTERDGADRRRLESERDAARLESAASKRSEAETKTLARRAVVAVLLGLGLAVAVGAAFLWLGPIWGVALAAACAIYLKLGWDWATKPDTSWKAIAVLGAAEAILLAAGLVASFLAGSGTAPPTP